MKKRFHDALKHPLISGSTVIIIGATITNIFNYIFNLGIGRLLSVADYGILAVLISLFNIFSVFSSSIITIFAKFSASLAGQNKEDQIPNLLRKGTMIIGGIGLLVFLGFIVFAKGMSNFLKITDIRLIYIMGFLIFFSFVGAVASGILQGLLKFALYSIVTVTSSIEKIIFGFLFVILGMKAFGAILGFSFPVVFGYIFSLLALRSFLFLKSKEVVLPNLHKELFSYGLPVFFSTVGITMLISIDIVMVKHFFPEAQAGQYAALSLMGRSIFFVVSPITFVLFPLLAQKNERKEDLSGTMALAALIISIPSLLLSLVYFLYPSLILRIFFPAKIYASLGQYLGPFSIFMLFYIFSWFLNTYYLSIGKTKVFIFTILATILEIIFITFFHQNVLQITTGLIIISFLLLISLLLYYPHGRNR